MMKVRPFLFTAGMILFAKLAGTALLFGNQVLAQNAPAAPASTAVSEKPAAASPTDTQASSQAASRTSGDSLDFSDSTIAILEKLSQRRKELEERSKAMDLREATLAAQEQRVDQKSMELKALKALLESALKQRSEEEEKQMQSLVKMYESMKPKDAAQIFEELDMDVLLEVVSRMSERKAAPVLGLLTPGRAKEITVELADRRKLPIAP